MLAAIASFVLHVSAMAAQPLAQLSASTGCHSIAKPASAHHAHDQTPSQVVSVQQHQHGPELRHSVHEDNHSSASDHAGTAPPDSTPHGIALCCGSLCAMALITQAVALRVPLAGEADVAAERNELVDGIDLLGLQRPPRTSDIA